MKHETGEQEQEQEMKELIQDLGESVGFDLSTIEAKVSV
jgi:hypothetical protein